jgi:hypothetical protein
MRELQKRKKAPQQGEVMMIKNKKRVLGGFV